MAKKAQNNNLKYFDCNSCWFIETNNPFSKNLKHVFFVEGMHICHMVLAKLSKRMLALQEIRFKIVA